jgi:glycosyltransferase involved in cell wall biosynthesis
MKKYITIFTPTFNRAYCLGQLYESLVRQTSDDFLWLVVDDGSSDNTKTLVDSWINEKKIEIQYIFKANEGMHSGHNVAYDNIDTELNMCIDSDDFLPEDAVEKIIAFWKKNRKPNWAGLLGLDAFKDGRIVGTPFPLGMTECKYSELSSRHKVVGDKKFVYNTEIIKKYPAYPIFKEEKFVPLGYKYMLIDQDYDLGVMHEVLCIVEYMPDGSSKNIFRQYRRHPKGFLHERKIRMVYSPTAKERFINAAHYVSSAIFLKHYKFLGESTNKGMTLLAIPVGILLNLYIRYTSKTGVIK